MRKPAPLATLITADSKGGGMYTAENIARVFEGIAPLDSGVPGDQLGFVYGNPTTDAQYQ